MAQSLKLGIRELVEFCCRSGDLGIDNGPGVKALDGLQTHQKIQRRYNALAEAEVRVGLHAASTISRLNSGAVSICYLRPNRRRVSKKSKRFLVIHPATPRATPAET